MALTQDVAVLNLFKTADVKVVEEETTPITEEEIRPEDIPLPRDSMITVRLSDAQLLAESPTTEESLDLQTPTALQHDLTATIASTSSRPSSRASSESSRISTTSNSVDWEGLEKSEEQEVKDDATDESTALLLARLEQENNALAIDPKAGISSKPKLVRNETRPASIHQLKKLVTGPQRQSLRYSLLPAPAMTELEFWAALVQDYRQTVQRLPTLTSNKIRGGVPPPLRGVVWPSIAGAQDVELHQDFERLCIETSPYDGLIGKDVGRSFPNVEMFREKDGEGQQMLRRVLRAFSLYDEKIGYCQGLGFVVGPLLMHMSEAEAFSVLVRLMEHYDLRSCYTPDLAGLHMRIYQFQTLLTRHLPELSAHLAALNVEPLYVSQWFLSFFAVTCPLPMLLRIYDIILAEGATETLMRVALSLMQRNQKKILGFSEFEDAMQFLLSRSLWDTYAQQADEMVSDFVSLTNLVSRETLQSLEADFRQSQIVVAPSPLKSAAASLLGRFWGGANHQPSKSALSLRIPDVTTVLTIRKTSSGNSLTSTMASVETTTSEASTAPTEISETDRAKSEVISIASSDTPPQSTTNSTDRDLHNQIEDLLTALGKLQTQQNELARELQREREEREEERILAKALLQRVQKQREENLESESAETQEGDEVDSLIEKATQCFTTVESRRISIIIQTKHQLRDAAEEYKQKHYMEAAKCRHLMQRLDEREFEFNTLKEELKEARQRIQDSHKEKQRMERQAQEQKSRSSPGPESPADLYTPVTEKGDFDFKLPAPAKGLREFRLGKSEQRSSSLPFSKRTSSLLIQSTTVSRPSSPEQQTQPTEALLQELVNAKTSEAVARQELEETKGKLDALRKIISGGASSPGPRAMEVPTITTPPPPPPSKTPEPVKPAHAASSSMGGFFSGWGKRSTS